MSIKLLPSEYNKIFISLEICLMLLKNFVDFINRKTLKKFYKSKCREEINYMFY